MMTTSNGFNMIVSKAQDENGEDCFTIQNRDTKEYLTCHDDNKHFWWNDTDEPWNWEHYYGEITSDNRLVFKTYFETFMCVDDYEESTMWQCYEMEDADVTFYPEETTEDDNVSEDNNVSEDDNVSEDNNVSEDDNVSEDEVSSDEPKDPTESVEPKESKKTKSVKGKVPTESVEPKESKKTKSVKSKVPKESKSDDGKAKREMSDEHKAKIALGKKAKALYCEGNRKGIEEYYENLEGKEKTKAVNKKLTEMYKELSKDERAAWEQQAAN